MDEIKDKIAMQKGNKTVELFNSFINTIATHRINTLNYILRSLLKWPRNSALVFKIGIFKMKIV